MTATLPAPGRRQRTTTVTAQLDLFDQPPVPRWTLTRPMATTRLRDHALRRLEAVRRHFPELDGICIKVGRTQSRKAHAWASLDPDEPTIWIKPGAMTNFTITHELTHLVQARGLIPRGEKTADLFALARHPELIDKQPSYLAVPRILFNIDHKPRHGVATLLHDAAVRAIDESPERPRRAIKRFESAVCLAGLPAALKVMAAAAGEGLINALTGEGHP